MSLRITGGDAKGRSLASPNGRDVRPTSSKIRQALFNILMNRLGAVEIAGGRESEPERVVSRKPGLDGCHFLDLFAGTGLMGIEALSRGASDLIAVEMERKLAQNIQDSLEKLHFDGEVIAGDVKSVLDKLPAYYFDIIFADPPYKSSLSGSTLLLVDKHNLLKYGGLLIIEHAKETTLPADKVTLQLVDHRDYGQTRLSFFSRKEPGRDKNNDSPQAEISGGSKRLRTPGEPERSK